MYQPSTNITQKYRQETHYNYVKNSGFWAPDCFFLCSPLLCYRFATTTLTAQIPTETLSQSHRLCFIGKERDSETGFSYFGARYYDSDILTGWLSVDPLADKYPNLSPYAYCAWNPVKLVDPDGEEIILSKSAEEIHNQYYNKKGYEEYTNLYNQLKNKTDILFIVGEINEGKNINADRKVGGTLVEIYPEEGEQYSDFNGSVYSLEWSSPQPEYGGNETHVFMEEMYHAKQVLDFNNNNGTIEKEVRAKEFAIRINPSVFKECTDSFGRIGVPTQLGIISEMNFMQSSYFLKNGMKGCKVSNSLGETFFINIPGAYSVFR